MSHNYLKGRRAHLDVLNYISCKGFCVDVNRHSRCLYSSSVLFMFFPCYIKVT